MLYANTNHTILGAVVEELTGDRAEDAIRRRVVEPLDLADTWLDGFEQGDRAGMPSRYHHATRDFRRDAGVSPGMGEAGDGLIDVSATNLSVEWVAGGMVSSASDLVRFGTALRDGWLLGGEAMALMRAWRPARPGVEVGLGLFRMAVPGLGHVVGHAGDVLGSAGALWWAEQGDVVAALLGNVGTMHAGEVAGDPKRVAHGPAFVRAAVAAASGRAV